MTDQEISNMLEDNGCEGAKFLTNFNYSDAIVYTTSDNRVIYDYDKMVECLIKEEGMTEEEAVDWIDYNTMRALPYFGEDAPIIGFPIIK